MPDSAKVISSPVDETIIQQQGCQRSRGLVRIFLLAGADQTPPSIETGAYRAMTNFLTQRAFDDCSSRRYTPDASDRISNVACCSPAW
jgi:hypothetical protein